MLKNGFITGVKASVLLVMFMSVSHAYTTQQQQYLDAKKALDKKQITQYQKLRKQLDDYPLTIYLDYHANINDIINLPGDKAHTEIEKFNQTPLYNSLRFRYLMNAGQQQHWQDFLTISPDTPKDVRLQCFHLSALLATGKKEQAFKGTEQIWLHGYSRPKECDSILSKWANAGHRTQPLIWSRMLLSFNARQSSLLNYLSTKVTSHRKEAEILLQVYKDPNRLRHTKRFMGSQPIMADIVDAGLRKLARKDLKQAVKLYVKYQKADRFSDFKERQLNRYLVRRALIAQEDGLKSHVDNMLPLLDSDDLYEMRMRWAIRQQDFDTVKNYLERLSDKGKKHSRWQYWSSRILENNAPESAKSVLSTLAGKRDFYGFNAAEALSQSIALNNANLVSNTDLRKKLFDDPAMARVVELRAINKTIDARAEWVQMMRRHDNAMTAEYGLYALEQDWFDLSVESSIQGKQWDALNLRFPAAANEQFVKASKKYQVNINEIRSIARRESAFNYYATSGVGARGLMQLMPATAKQTARKNNISYSNVKDLYKPSTNVMLGSAYYAELLRQFDNNRVLATAAYNAGPSNVKRWLKVSDGKLDVMSFIESIPFTETREYVQAVFSYRMIFEHPKKDASMFSELELNYHY
ncbi:transglycosylase SLT domain-containing protein [Shewanella gaetbuli]